MANKPRTITLDDESPITPEEMQAARARARAKLATQMAERELGLETATVVKTKGPLPLPGERQITFRLELPPDSHRVMIDGQIFQHGRTYTLGERQYKVIAEMVARGWRQEEIREGKDTNFYRKNANIRISGRNMERV